jgi:glycosyltransferase involved in cell wall biosynthesis
VLFSFKRSNTSLKLFQLASILMTSYNRQQFLAEAIESVLASTYQNWELIIVDDCSKDNTVAIARTYALNDSRIKVFKNEINLGDYSNRNKFISFAKVEYIMFCDSDDKLFPNSIDKIYRCNKHGGQL